MEKTETKNNFEEKLTRLEQLSEKIKQSDISLEEAVKTFEEGIKLSKTLENELQKIESKIQILMNNPVAEPKQNKVEPELSLFSIEDER